MTAVTDTVTASTYRVLLYLSGPIETAKHILRAECLREGLCVTVEPTTFIYTGGEEAGYVVGLLNRLLAETFQHSALLVTPDTSEWVTVRRELPHA